MPTSSTRTESFPSKRPSVLNTFESLPRNSCEDMHNIRPWTRNEQSASQRPFPPSPKRSLQQISHANVSDVAPSTRTESIASQRPSLSITKQSSLQTSHESVRFKGWEPRLGEKMLLSKRLQKCQVSDGSLSPLLKLDTSECRVYEEYDPSRSIPIPSRRVVLGSGVGPETYESFCKEIMECRS